MDSNPSPVSVEVGLVSSDRRLVDFYIAAFGLRELAELHFESGTLHRLQSDEGMMKVFVPTETPAAGVSQPHLSTRGFGYLTVRVADFDDVMRNVELNGGTVLEPPQELAPGRRLALVRDPEGIAIEVIEDARR